MRLGLSVAALSSLFLSSALLTGCGAGFNTPAAPETLSLGPIQGVVHGGQQPIAGSHIYLYAVTVASDYAQASTSLLTAAANTTSDGSSYYVTTDSGGFFSVTGDYTCTSGQQVYLVASGGDAGAGENPAIKLLAPLGQCGASGTLAGTVPNVVINEVTTVAMGYAFAGLANASLNPNAFNSGDETHLSVPNTTAGISAAANAMALALQITDISTGTARSLTTNGNGIIPYKFVNTVADALASCVNQGTGVISNDSCYMFGVRALYYTTTFGTLYAPSTTGAMIMHLAQAAGGGLNYNNAESIYALVQPNAPFQPTLTSAPDDLSLRIDYFTGSQITTYGKPSKLSTYLSPYTLAIDANGTAWFAGKYLYTATPTGAFHAWTGNSYTAPGGAAFDPISGDLFIGEVPGLYDSFVSSNLLYIRQPDGTTNSYNVCGKTACGQLISDGNGYIYASNYANSLLRFTTSAVAQSSATTIAPTVLAIDYQRNPWVSDNNTIQWLSFNSGAAATLRDTWTPAPPVRIMALGFIDAGYLMALDFDSTNLRFAVGYSYPNGTAQIIPDTAANGTLGTGVTSPAFMQTNSLQQSIVTGVFGSKLGISTFSSAAGQSTTMNLDTATSPLGNLAVDNAGNIWVIQNNDANLGLYVGATIPAPVPTVPISPIY